MDNKPDYDALIGSLHASIGLDSRYTDTLEVHYNPAQRKVTVIVREHSPMGGMDSFGVSHFKEERAEFIVNSPKDVEPIFRQIKSILGDNHYNFKRYGKPTKNMALGDRMGFSKKNLLAAIFDEG